MRTLSFSLAFASILATACGSQHDRPSMGTAYPETSETSAPILVTNGGKATESASIEEGSSKPKTDPSSCTPKTCESECLTCGTLDDGCGGTEECGTCEGGLVCTNDGGGNCANPATICKAADMRLMGSCAAYADGPRFDSGAQCEDFYDSRASATAQFFEYMCDCNQGVWSLDPCSARVKSSECTISGSASTCGRVVSCFAAK